MKQNDKSNKKGSAPSTTQKKSSSSRGGPLFALLTVLVAAWVYANQHRVFIFARALHKLMTLSDETVNNFMDSYRMYDKPVITDNGHNIAGWYAVLNQFCTLGEVERMYIPPLLDPSASLSKNQDLMEERMASDLGVRPGGNVLDVGCGRGRIAAHMQSVGKFNVTGINIDRTQIDEANENAKFLNLTDFLHFQVHDYNTPFPFPDESFDGVYEVGAIMYVKDGDFVPVFREIYRILKPGGRVAFNDWVIYDKYDPKNPEHAELLRKVREVTGWVYLARTHEMSDAMETAGFKVLYNGTFTDHGHTYAFLERVDGFFQAASWLISALDKLHILPRHVAPLFERATRGGEAVVEGDKMGLFTVEWYTLGEKPNKQFSV